MNDRLALGDQILIGHQIKRKINEKYIFLLAYCRKPKSKSIFRRLLVYKTPKSIQDKKFSEDSSENFFWKFLKNISYLFDP